MRTSAAAALASRKPSASLAGITMPAAEIRSMCNGCHNDTAPSGGGYVAGPVIRDREPSVRPSKVSAHVSGTVSCAVCHAVHNPKVGTDCLSCHKSATGGKAGPYEYVGMLFKGTGLPVSTRPADTVVNGRPWSWSQHGNALSATNDYKGSFATKADNFCLKCHGGHGSGWVLVQADPGDTGSDAFIPVASLRAVTTPVARTSCGTGPI